jgi:soluble lytic murein transglycosylase-like protein
MRALFFPIQILLSVSISFAAFSQGLAPLEPASLEQKSLSEVDGRDLLGLDAEPEDVKARLLGDAAAYAAWRQAPTRSENQVLSDNCSLNQSQNIFCSFILHPNENLGKSDAPEPDSPKALRVKFFSAILSLDKVSTRAAKCGEASKVLASIAADKAALSLHIRSLYWLWACSDATGKRDEAKKYLDQLWTQFPLDYHTVVAMTKAHDERLNDVLTRKTELKVQFRSTKDLQMNWLIGGIEALHRIGEDGAAGKVESQISGLLTQADDLEPAVRLYVASLMNRVSKAVPSVKPATRQLVPLIVSQPEVMEKETLKMLYPIDYVVKSLVVSKPDEVPQRRSPEYKLFDVINAEKQDLDVYFVHALIHQESAFYQRTVSPAKPYPALGLMQLLQPTAAMEFKKMPDRDQHADWVDPTTQLVKVEKLFDPPINVRLGVIYYQTCRAKFNGNDILALASYNAGPDGVANWLKAAPKMEDPDVLIDLLFMDRDPEYHVSRYVTFILGKYEWYKKLYASPPDQK